MKITCLITALYSLLTLSGCNPERNPGDLLVGSTSSGILAAGNVTGSFTALYGTEIGHPDPNRSDPARANHNLLLVLFILTPQEKTWRFAGGGSDSSPWYYGLFYSARWLHYPRTIFIKPDNNGIISENTERRNISWEFDGRNRSISIAGSKYPISVGDFVIVKLNKHWIPEVGVAEASFDLMQIPPEARQLISQCLVPIKKGINALTNACNGPA